MATMLPEAARVYLTEHTLLEKARRDLHDALDAIWRGAWDRVQPEAERMASAYGASIIMWINDSNPGHCEVRTDGKPKVLPVILMIRDPRVANEGEGIELVLFVRGKERRDPALGDVRKRFEDVCKAESMVIGDWRKGSEIWLKSVPIADDLEHSIEALAEEVLTVLRAITKFESENAVQK